MFAIGFLSLLSVGLVAMSAGGDDDGVELDESGQDQDEFEITLGDVNTQEAFDALDPEVQEQIDAFIAGDEAEEPTYDTSTRNDLIQTYVPIEEVDEETNARITEFFDALDPDQPIIEAADEFRSFVTDIGVGIIDNTESEVEPEADEPEVETVRDYDDETRKDLIQTYVHIGEVDGETDARITAYLDTLDPDQPINEAASAFRTFVSELGVEVTNGAAADEESDDGVIRPPMGDEHRDPIVIADELEAQRLAQEAADEAQRIADEIAAEEARQPVNLVTVSSSTGSEISDDLVLAERAEGADEATPAFTVTAPGEANNIEVGYDAEHTFQIDYNAQTETIQAGLNSIIDGPDGSTEATEKGQTDDNGVDYTEFLRTKTFDGSTDITLDVAQDDIGPHIAQVDLVNPEDALHFEFDAEVTSAFHLVYHEVEEGRDGFSDTTKRAYVLETAADVTSLSANDVARILAEDDPESETGRVVSEIYLGEDSVLLNGDPEDGVPYEIRISNFINDDPQISANVDWASVSEFDQDEVDEAAQALAENGGGAEGGEDDSINSLLLNAGLNPGFFGF